MIGAIKATDTVNLIEIKQSWSCMNVRTTPTDKTLELGWSKVSVPATPQCLAFWMTEWEMFGSAKYARRPSLSYLMRLGGDSIALCQAYIIPVHKIRRPSEHHIWFRELTLSCFRPCHRLCHLEGTTWWGEPPRSSTPRLSMGSELLIATKVFNPNSKAFHGVCWDRLGGFMRLRESSTKTKKLLHHAADVKQPPIYVLEKTYLIL